MEILILIIGLSLFSNDLENKETDVNLQTQKNLKKSTNCQKIRFEIVNKNGVWIIMPIGVNKKQKMIKIQGSPSKFIILPDGSKIEKGI